MRSRSSRDRASRGWPSKPGGSRLRNSEVIFRNHKTYFIFCKIKFNKKKVGGGFAILRLGCTSDNFSRRGPPAADLGDGSGCRAHLDGNHWERSRMHPPISLSWHPLELFAERFRENLSALA